MVLDVDDQARDEGTQDLGNNISDCLQRREALEYCGRNCDTGTEVSPRHRSTDGNREDDSYGIGKTNAEQGYVKTVSEKRRSYGTRGRDQHPVLLTLVILLKLKMKVGPTPAKV